MWFHGRADVRDAGPTLGRRWTNVSSLLKVSAAVQAGGLFLHRAIQDAEILLGRCLCLLVFENQLQSFHTIATYTNRTQNKLYKRLL